MSTSHRRLGVALMAASAVGLAIVTITAKAHSQERAQETARAAAPALKLAVTTSCRAGAATFTVRNTGARWPRTSTFAIYRLGKGPGRVISKRRMRLSAGQQASFRIKASKNLTGRLGLFVDPGWYERPAEFDATVDCR